VFFFFFFGCHENMYEGKRIVKCRKA